MLISLINCHSTNGNEKTGYLPYHKNSLEMVKHLKTKSIKLLEETTGERFQDTEFGNFLVVKQTTQYATQIDYIKLENFCFETRHGHEHFHSPPLGLPA